MKTLNKSILFSIMFLMIFVAGCTTQTVEEPGNTTYVEDNNQGNTKIFLLTGGNYWFEMDGERSPVIRVNQGDIVRIEFTAVEGYHDWVIDEFNAATEKVTPEQGTTFVEFVADKKGTFEYYCSVGQHRANGMYGTLIVE